MPCLKILTNIPMSKIPGDFVDKMIPVLAKAVKKEEYFSVGIGQGTSKRRKGLLKNKPTLVKGKKVTRLE